jgi:type I restriction enzyme M protein
MSERLNKLTKDAVTMFERGRILYPEAEQELLERIGIKDENRNSELFFMEEFSKTLLEFRSDAEHFQPKYKRLRNHLAKNSLKIGEFCPTPFRGIQPVFVSDGDVWVIASKSNRPQGVLLNAEERTRFEFYEDQQITKAIVKKGDVLLNSTGVGTLGRASFYLEDDPAIADNHVAILKPNIKICETAYLSLFLNSSAGLAQSEMFQTGSSGQLEIYSKQIKEILVFLPRNKDGSIDTAWQKKLAQKVIEASTTKRYSQKLIEEEKQVIEESIGI